MLKPDSNPTTPLASYKPAEPIDCCVRLRGKSMFYRADERPGRMHESDVMHYWCTHTHTQVGPDDLEARPCKCQTGRGCFQAEE